MNNSGISESGGVLYGGLLGRTVQVCSLEERGVGSLEGRGVGCLFSSGMPAQGR